MALPIVLALAGWVLDPTGPVAGAEVRVVELQPMTCPCAPVVDEIGHGNEVPDCHCPAALAMWRKRLASCTWPTKAVQVTRTDNQGRVALDGRAAGHSIEAWTATGVKWLDVPASADRAGIELEPAVRPRLIVDTTADLRAALMFEDGHCVPLRRDGGTSWLAAAPVSLRTDEFPTLVIEANGYAPVVRSWYEGFAEPLELSLAKARPIKGVCRGDRVELANPLQHVVVRGGVFSVADMLDLETEVTCKRGNKVQDAWSFTYADGLQETGTVYGGLLGGDCHDVEVVDRAGTPLANAEVSVFYTHGGSGGMSWGSGTSTTTDARGKTCASELFEGAELVVHPPPERGGMCAGEVKLRVTAKLLAKPVRVRLDVQPMQRARWRGRVVSAEKMPLAGAGVTITSLEPSEGKSCSLSADITVPVAPDGRFELPLVPLGKATIRIEHAWFTPLELEIKVPGPERELVLQRGATLTGRVLDANGAPIDRCDAQLTLSDQRRLSATCTPAGFSFRTVVPGNATLAVHRHDATKDALPDERAFIRTIKLGTARTLVHDVTWPVTSRKHLVDVP